MQQIQPEEMSDKEMPPTPKSLPKEPRVEGGPVMTWNPPTSGQRKGRRERGKKDETISIALSTWLAGVVERVALRCIKLLKLHMR